MALRDLLIQLKIVSNTKGLDAAAKKLDTVKDRAGGVVGGLANLKAAFAGFAAAVAAQQVTQFVGQTIEAADATGELAAQLGITSDAYQQWVGFVSLAGGSADGLKTSVRALAGQMQAAASTGSGPGAEGFKRLGIEIKNADGSLRAIDGVMFDVGSKLAEMPDVTARTALAVDLLGRSGMAMIPAFEGGTEAARAQLAKMKELAVVYDSDFIKAASDANDQIAFMRMGFQRLKVSIVSAILPQVRGLVEWVAKGAQAISKLFKETTALRTIFMALGGLALAGLIAKFGGIMAIVTKLGGVLRMAGAAFMRFLLPALILDDIIGGLQGKDSVFTDILTGLFGDAGAKELIASINELTSKVIPAMASAFQATLPVIRGALSGIGTGVSLLGQAWGGLFTIIRMGWADSAEEQDALFTQFMVGTRGLTDAMIQFDTYMIGVRARLDAWLGGLIDRFIGDIPGAFAAAGAAFTRTFVDPILRGLAAIDAFFSRLSKQFPTLASLGEGLGGLAGRAAGTVASVIPQLSGGGNAKSLSMSDHRSVSITVGSNATPGETGRATAAAVGAILNTDRRASLAAMGGT